MSCFGESAAHSQHNDLLMDSASIQLTGKIIFEHKGVSLFKIGRRKLWLELPKDDRCRSQYSPCLSNSKGWGYWHIVNWTGPCASIVCGSLLCLFALSPVMFGNDLFVGLFEVCCVPAGYMYTELFIWFSMHRFFVFLSLSYLMSWMQ